MRFRIREHGPPIANVGPQAQAREHAATIQALGICGIDLSTNPVGQDPRKLIEAVGSTFISELPPVRYMKNISSTERQFISSDLQPAIRKGLQRGDENFLNAAHQLGRLIGSDGRNFNILKPPVLIFPGHVETDGIAVPYAMQEGKVLELGMGLLGLYSHIQNIKNNRYSATGVHASTPEVRLLKGVAEVNGLGDSPGLKITDEGIQKALDGVSLDASGSKPDIIIASRVHAAGVHLKRSLGQISSALRPGGLFIARGPRRYKQGIGYDQVATFLSRDPKMQTIANKTYNLPSAQGAAESNRVYIAARST